MRELERMAENVHWLAKADFLCPTIRFGAVSRKYLNGLRDKEALFYFEHCIPSADYGLSTASIGFEVCAEDALVFYAEDVATCEPLMELGLITVAFDPSGEPLVLDVESGQLWHFHTGYIRDQSLRFYSAQDDGFVGIPLTKENVFKMAEARFDGFCSFLRHAREATTKEETHSIWHFIDDEDVEYIDHLMSLGLDLNIVNEAGRNPAEEAEHQGKSRLARMLQRYLDGAR